MIGFGGTLMEALGMEVVSIAKDRVVVSMPVDERTRQPFGYLHGGATAALLETVASMGAVENVDLATHIPFGVEICIRHRRSARDGRVTGEATPAEISPDRQVWDVRSFDAEGTLLSEGICTIRVVMRPY